MIVGVTGYFCAGKDAFAAILEKRSFSHISLSDMIREEIRRRGQRVTLPRLTETGNALRREFGPQVLAAMALERMDPTKNFVVTSIRSPGEVAALRRREDFAMVFVEASIKTRFARSLMRKRSGDPKSEAEFRAAEKAQLESGDPAAQQLKACRDAADLRIRNDGSLEALEKKVVAMLQRIARERTVLEKRMRSEVIEAG